MRRPIARPLVTLLLVVSTAGAGCAGPPAAGPGGETPAGPDRCTVAPGTVCAGINEWIRYEAGDLPIVISVPHGGAVAPPEVPDRQTGTVVTDRNTIELARAIAEAFGIATGATPHLVINQLRRTKLDVNREVGEAAQGHAAMIQAWTEYHAFIERAMAAIETEGLPGMFIDLHGHAHAINRIEWGYLVPAATLDLGDAELDRRDVGPMSSLARLLPASPDTFSDVLRGPTSLGGLLTSAVESVPSPAAPSPGDADYFAGGYTTARHTARMAGVQLEAPFRGLRDTAVNRRSFADALVEAMRAFMSRQLSVDLPEPGGR